MSWIESVFLLIGFGAAAVGFGCIQKYMKICEERHQEYRQWRDYIAGDREELWSACLKMQSRVHALPQQASEPPATTSPDRNVEAIRQRLLERSEVGLRKYGVTTERTDLELTDWFRHTQEELLDAAVYIEALLKRLDHEGSKS